jgi:hypothetical protein
MQSKIVSGNCPVPSWFHNAQGVGYSQWATSFLTRDNDPPADSVVDVVNSVAGYPEYFFWKSAYFLPKLSEANKAIF